MVVNNQSKGSGRQENTALGRDTAQVASVPSSVEHAPSVPKEQHDLADMDTGDASDIQDERHDSRIDFWNMNIPLADHTVECPQYLLYAFENGKDRAVLATPDGEYQRHAWAGVRQIIQENRLDSFTRVPSELRLYRKYCHKLVQEYGSIMKFVLDERLHWSGVGTDREPFSRSDDYKILYNDWPYGVDTRIVHLVVWTKFELPADPDSAVGDMSLATRAIVDAFVRRTFCGQRAADNVIWFKNWSSLKSVHAVEHFHVMLFAPDMDYIRTITNGDVPLFQKVRVAKENGAA